MRERKRLSSGDLLLLELVFAIIFFSLTMAATMSVFGRAYEMSREAAAQNMAITESDTAAEIVRAAGSVEEIDRIFRECGFTAVSGGYEKSYGEDKFIMRIMETPQEKLVTADISCYQKKDGAPEGEPIYTLTIKHALKGGG